MILIKNKYILRVIIISISWINNGNGLFIFTIVGILYIPLSEIANIDNNPIAKIV